MKTRTHVLKPLFGLCITAMVLSCNSSSTSETAATDSSTAMADTTAATTAPATPAAPFDVVEIIHTVKDYDKWETAFDADSAARQQSGLSFVAVGKDADNPNKVEVVLMASDMAKAKAFATDARLKTAMTNAGVTGKPEMDYWHVIRYNAANDNTTNPWIQVTHKVKNFDAWAKVFDGEGPSARAAYGLSDVALARGVDDSNLVHIVFAVTDMNKAKARMKDPALKKLMTSAGVIGAPKIEFFNDAAMK